MVRTRSPQRLEAIVTAALTIFTSLGYRRARMSDVAAAAGVSPGLLYTYAESKEALFALVVRRESGVDITTLPLPVPTPDARELTELVHNAFRRAAPFTALDAAEGTGEPADVTTEVRAVVGELFDTVAANRALLRLVERCALDWPELATGFYDLGRRPLIDRLTAYLERRRADGLLAPVGDAEVAARFVVETCAWFADHRHGDHDGAQLPDAAVRAEVVALVTRALTGR